MNEEHLAESSAAAGRHPRVHKPGVITFKSENHRERNEFAHQMLDHGVQQKDLTALSHSIHQFEQLIEEDELLLQDRSILGKLARASYMQATFLSEETQLSGLQQQQLHNSWQKCYEYSARYVGLHMESAMKTAWAGIAAHKLGDYEGAMHYFEWFFHLDDRPYEYEYLAYEMLIHAYQMLGQYDDQYLTIEQYLNHAQCDLLLRYRAYQLAVDLGEYQSAYHHLIVYVRETEYPPAPVLELGYFAMCHDFELGEVFTIVTSLLDSNQYSVDSPTYEGLAVLAIDLYEAMEQVVDNVPQKKKKRKNPVYKYAQQLVENDPEHYRALPFLEKN